MDNTFMNAVYYMVPVLTVAALGQTWTPQTWVPQPSGTIASLRGVSAVSGQVAWASGTGGTWLRTSDGGKVWKSGVVAGAAALDFRGVWAESESTAWLMSIGPGDNSRVYKTTDAGATWSLLFTNPDAKGFCDAIAFWDARHGILAGDAVDGRMTVFTTSDAGAHWDRQQLPPVAGEEGAFAASNSSLHLAGKAGVWLGTGGKGAARVLHSIDGGRTWTAATTPIRNDGPAAGIFSVAFRDPQHGMAVGGDYGNDKDTQGNIAVTSDGGRTWSEPPSRPAGFRSAAVYLSKRRLWIVTGTSGSDFSTDDGKTWKQFDQGSYNSIAVAGGGESVWAVGAGGRIARLAIP
jgi:photosystem II stability/assembly factor-like uncharacterized protein